MNEKKIKGVVGKMSRVIGRYNNLSEKRFETALREYKKSLIDADLILQGVSFTEAELYNKFSLLLTKYVNEIKEAMEED